MAVPQVRDYSYEFQELGTMFFIFVVYRYFIAPAIFRTAAVSFLDGFLSFKLLETIESWFRSERRWRNRVYGSRVDTRSNDQW